MAKLLTIEQALDLPAGEAARLYREHVNPALLEVYRILGVADFDAVRAQGMEIELRDGRIILDFSSSLGILGLGHHHPKIDAVEAECKRRQVLEAIKVAPQKLQAVLGYNLAALLPAPLSVSFFTTSGAEAVEAALKLCERAQGPARRRFIVTGNAYHGKTHTALSLSRTEDVRESFIQGIPEELICEVPYGDRAALVEALGPDVVAVILEPIQGQGVRVPPPGYLAAVVQAAHEHGVLVIFDEVKVGMGRTGAFCAFQHEAVVPDAVTLSKALGGGTRAIGAMVTSPALFKSAYGRREEAGLHSTTFGGLGTSCAVAIEVLNIIGDSAFLASVQAKGEYLRGRLDRLKEKYPREIRDIRGRGLLQAIEFNMSEAVLGSALGKLAHPLVNSVEKAVMAGLIRMLYQEYGILAHFSASDIQTLHIMPPLIVEATHIDTLVSALDLILGRGLRFVLESMVKDQARDWFRG